MSAIERARRKRASRGPGGKLIRKRPRSSAIARKLGSEKPKLASLSNVGRPWPFPAWCLDEASGKRSADSLWVWDLGLAGPNVMAVMRSSPYSKGAVTGSRKLAAELRWRWAIKRYEFSQRMRAVALAHCSPEARSMRDAQSSQRKQEHMKHAHLSQLRPRHLSCSPGK